MRFDVHLRSSVRSQIEGLVEQMREWEQLPRVGEQEADRLRETIQEFRHLTRRDGLNVAGVDGTGDYPALTYGDSFVYLTVAHGTSYDSDLQTGLKEASSLPEPVIDFCWLPERQDRANEVLEQHLAQLAGEEVRQVIQESDYRSIKAKGSGRTSSVESLYRGLIRPHASDSGNLAIQLRSTGELGAAFRLLQSSHNLSYLLVDGTFSLPFVGRPDHGLFYEHLKRFCCVKARAKRIGFFALSKSHGLPGAEILEGCAREKLGVGSRAPAQHWYLRIPRESSDGWKLSIVEGRNVPPPGAVSYLVRFHKTTPIMRLDMDAEFWVQTVRDASEEQTRENERRIFSDLDYTCHDQRCYGYPYPIKAAHDRASLTKAERVALRKQIIDAAVAAGMKRSLFRDVSQATGHG